MTTPQQFKSYDTAWTFVQYLLENGVIAESLTTMRMRSYMHNRPTNLRTGRDFTKHHVRTWVFTQAARYAQDHYDDYIVWATMERLKNTGNV